MNEQAQKIFNNPQLLRNKLAEFLRTPEKVEIYAQAAEKFYIAGNKKEISFNITWSWWGFFFANGFLFYRKAYKSAIIISIITIIIGAVFLPLCLFINLYVAIQGKYIVIKRFEQALDTGEETFIQMSGYAKWVLYLALVQIIFIMLFCIAALFGMPAGSASASHYILILLCLGMGIISIKYILKNIKY